MRKIILFLACFCVVGIFILQQKQRPAQTPIVKFDAVSAPEVPAFVAEHVPGVLSVANDHAIFLGEDERIYAWRDNSSKQLGVESGDYLIDPISFDGPGPVKAIHTGSTASYLITADAKLWRRGFADVERRLQLYHYKYLPVHVDKAWRKVEEHWALAAGIDSENKLWAWRDRDFFDGKIDQNNQREAARVELIPMSVSTEWQDFCVGHGSINAIDKQGRWWRSDVKDKLDFNGNAIQANDASKPSSAIDLVQVPASARFTRVVCRDNSSHVIALDDQHKMWGYGTNKYGELGNGDDDQFKQTAPVDASQAIQLNQQEWIDVAVGTGFTIAIARDGSLWSWGLNSTRALGLKDEQSHSKPTLVDKTQIWFAVGAAYDFGVAMNQQGEIYNWGSGQYRQSMDEEILKVKVLPTKLNAVPKAKIP